MIDRLHLYLITIIALVGVFFAGRFVEWDKIRIEQKAADAVHKQELTAAEHAHDQELADLRNTKPLPAVRLCIPVQAGKAASAGPSSAERTILPVHDGADPVRPEQPSGADQQQAGPDISVLLGLFALRADEVSADLREQQAVK